MRLCSPCLRRVVLALVSVVEWCLLLRVLFLASRGVCEFLTVRKIGVLYALSTLGHPSPLVGGAFAVFPKE